MEYSEIDNRPIIESNLGCVKLMKLFKPQVGNMHMKPVHITFG